MATATEKVQRAGPIVAGASNAQESLAMAFLADRDNDGRFHWVILAGGDVLVRSGGFASYSGAELAASRVHAEAGSARCERWPTDDHELKFVVPARLDATPPATGGPAAECWLEDGANIGRAAAAR